jgi:hypothetical protein
MSEPSIFPQKVFFRFSNEVKLFGQLAHFYYNTSQAKLYMALPVIVFYGDFLNKKKLFQTTFTIAIDNLSDVDKYSEGFNFGIVNKFFDKHFPNSTFLQELEIKANKWISADIIKAVKIKNEKNGEFIEVDEDTSFYGNYVQNDKEGCHLTFGKNRSQELTSLDSFLNLWNHHIPRDVKVDFNLYLMDKKTKLAHVKSLGLKNSLDTIKNLLKGDKSEQVDEKHCPFYIRLSGSDNDSWTKYFCTEEEMMAEVYRLRRCQPINKQIDVEDNGYYFTN